MTYLQLYDKARKLLDNSEITLGEYLDMIKPLGDEIIVRCKDCDNRHTDGCPMYHEEWYEIDEGDGYIDNDFTVHDYSQDDGFCSWAKMKGGNDG